MIARYAIMFFYTMGLVVIPLLLFFLCRWLMPKRYGWKVGAALAALVILLVGYGTIFGYTRLEVRQVEYVSSDLPAAFDGYRIVYFSDAHVGSMNGFEVSGKSSPITIGNRSSFLHAAIDSMLAQKADMIVFVGDLQNLEPTELLFQEQELKRLRASDGVYSVLGNHDYAIYLPLSEEMKTANEEAVQEFERYLGWDLLMNEHRIIRRDSDSIVVAGMENWGEVKRMPRRGDVKKTLAGLTGHPFIVMLQHDPTAWRKKILPESDAQLTLSGHTHGGQFSIFGWSPASLFYDEWNGTTYEGSRAIDVTSGLGALIPFRLGMSGEIVVVTLRRK